MGHGAAGSTLDDSDGRCSPEPTDRYNRPATVPVVGVVRHPTNLTTSSSSTDDDANYSRKNTYISRTYTDDGPNIPYGIEDSKTKRNSQIPSCWSRQVVLSLDGGDIRGLSELYILQRIFQAIARLERELDGATSSSCSPLLGSPNADDDAESSQSNIAISTEGYLPCHYFDYIGGTSMGGVSAVMLGRLRLSIDKTIEHYENIWASVANEVSQYRQHIPGRRLRSGYTEGLRKALNNIVPKAHPASAGKTIDETFRSDASLCRTLVLAVQIDRENGVRRPYLFRSYTFKDRSATAVNRNKTSETEGTPLHAVCRATSAAPNYFQSVIIDKKKFRDGSIWMANPSMELYREVHSMHPDHPSPIYCLLSIGCGKQKRSRYLPNISMRAASLYNWEQQQVDDVLTARKSQGEDFDYVRFLGPADLADPKPSDWRQDGTRRKTVERIRISTARYCDNPGVSAQIDATARQLVQYRRQRARTAHWERFALGITYKCVWCAETGGQGELNDRDDVIDHVQSKHKDLPGIDSHFFGEYRRILEDFRVKVVDSAS
ncbi:FabD/lysophospholipase-like protein [Lepidopterella palustris CBS 459.81]|uniref:FabD/lysophospholipase-like protein n=1 Tax=Lepidopterella palustris CBS 459.81 TaxID=1314670 RepID=A0A8E2EJK3_9PEZI|nr:FabD/lysophospholipase-like protein [Lepidopterella palustris CBS 459.81]